MIQGNIKSYKKIQGIHPQIIECIKHVSDINIENFQESRLEIGSGCILIASEYLTQPINDHITIEGHRKFVDLQYVVHGSESIFYVPLSSVPDTGEYNAKDDVWKAQIPTNKAQRIKLSSGDFLILFPEDAHGPQYFYETSSSLVKKVVVKIPIDLIKFK